MPRPTGLLLESIGHLRTGGRLLMAIARELADETAYARHLAAHQREHSPEEWRRFSEERLNAKYLRAKCC